MNFIQTLFRKIGHSTSYYNLVQRALLRSLVLGLLLLTAGAALELLVWLSRSQGYDIAARYPELLVVFRAVAILVWFEMSVFWIRMATQPKVDGQEPATVAMTQPSSAATVYIVQTCAWAFRIYVLLRLCDF
jgi:hypothetical protein